MDIGLNEVRDHVEQYFKEHLPKYTVLEIRKKSYHPDDACFYMVSAKKEDGTYAVWTSWNEQVHSLNYGHYDLVSVEDCEQIFAEFYFRGQEQGTLALGLGFFLYLKKNFGSN